MEIKSALFAPEESVLLCSLERILFAALLFTEVDSLFRVFAVWVPLFSCGRSPLRPWSGGTHGPLALDAGPQRLLVNQSAVLARE